MSPVVRGPRYFVVKTDPPQDPTFNQRGIDMDSDSRAPEAHLNAGTYTGAFSG